ncbi:hypothetical protein CH76_00570 [Lysinibacillus sp. BF-4]|uniref:MotE family protein n=1 Tax=Lysinibacillus sp. BF-4 TaxID=1473546 RepID=UPI000505D79C|nr:hypothetical protein [Lysinibacillus sp. BF-4]KFL44338.1 hypothetical protein CH76_00570 [Lysinibacillus sp. BF-4]
MAKEQQSTPELEPKKKSGFFKKLFLFFIVPLTFIIAVLLVVTQLLNVNVFNLKDMDIPFVTSQKEKTKEQAVNNDEKVLELQGVIAEKEAQIAEIQAQLKTAEESNEKLLAEQEKITFELEKVKREKDDTKSEHSEIVATYEKMSAKAAAPAIVKLSDAEALRILAGLKTDTLAKIFEKMTPEQAAKYTELLAKQ